MRMDRPSPTLLLAGIVGIATGGCSGSNAPATGTGGTAGTQSFGGATSGGSGQSASGGISAGGSTGGQSSAGGTSSGGAAATSGGTTTTSGGTASTSGGARSSGGVPGSGGSAASGGSVAKGGSAGALGGGGKTSGGSAATGGALGNGGSGGDNPGACTASKAAGSNASGSGPHKVTVETNASAGINEGTIFRPTDLGGSEKYPIFVWGEGGCSQNGLSNAVAMGEIASHGYFVIADGTPNNSSSRSMDSSNPANMGKPLLAYIDWAITENDKPCSAYYHSLDTKKIAANGFSCGGLMAEGTAGDPRITTWGINSSGLFGANQAFYKTIHTPVLIVLGGPDDIAYENGERDYDNISALGIPIMLFSKALGHGGDLFSKNGGDFTKIDLAWLNWWLKGDETATGKAALVGSGCTYCSNSAWEVKSKNLP